MNIDKPTLIVIVIALGLIGTLYVVLGKINQKLVDD